MCSFFKVKITETDNLVHISVNTDNKNTVLDTNHKNTALDTDNKNTVLVTDLKKRINEYCLLRKIQLNRFLLRH